MWVCKVNCGRQEEGIQSCSFRSYRVVHLLVRVAVLPVVVVKVVVAMVVVAVVVVCKWVRCRGIR